MTSTDRANDERAEVDRLIAELAKAEAYEQRLRQYFVDIRAELAAGRTSAALSMLNEALSYIDDAVDVVAPHRGE
jgi:RPA family protein